MPVRSAVLVGAEQQLYKCHDARYPGWYPPACPDLLKVAGRVAFPTSARTEETGTSNESWNVLLICRQGHYIS